MNFTIFVLFPKNMLVGVFKIGIYLTLISKAYGKNSKYPGCYCNAGVCVSVCLSVCM